MKIYICQVQRLMVSPVVILVILFVLIFSGAIAYHKYQTLPSKVAVPSQVTVPINDIRDYYCNHDMTYCNFTDPTKAPIVPTVSSKWIKFYNSCRDCIGSYYYTFGADALGECILRLQVAKSAQDIDDALNLLAQSIDVNGCKGIVQKDRPTTQCLFFSNNEGNVDFKTIDNIYDTIRNGLTKSIKSATAKTEWLTKYEPMVKNGTIDPFLVMFYMALKQTSTNGLVYFSHMEPDKKYDCSPNPKMSQCGK